MEIEFRRLRADEARERAAANAIAIVPLGSIEQHGPHLPVEVDSLLAQEVAMRAARKLDARGEAVVTLPAVWMGLSEHHMSFGGTITLDLPAYTALVGGICRSLVRLGFRRLVLLNGHGGNDNALRAITDDLTPRLGVPILQFTYWNVAADAVAALLETQTALLHACEAETAMTMHLRPRLVAKDRIPEASQAMEYVQPGPYRWRALGAVSGTGVIGNPSAATPEKGEKLLEAIATRVADVLGDADLWAAAWEAG